MLSLRRSLRTIRAAYFLAGAIAISSCGYSDADRQRDQAAIEALQTEIEMEEEAESGIADIAYPICDAVSDGDEPTSCGLEILKLTMAECRSRALTYSGGSAILDKGAGDSWIYAGGTDSVLSIEERALIKARRRNGTERVAVLHGNGTRTVKVFACSTDADWRLTGIFQARSVQAQPF